MSKWWNIYLLTEFSAMRKQFIFRSSDTSLHSIEQGLLFSNLNDVQLNIATHLPYAKMRDLCMQLGGSITLSIDFKTLKLLKRIGNSECEIGGSMPKRYTAYFLGATQGRSLNNGSFEWLDDRPGHDKKPILDLPWMPPHEPDGGKFEKCVASGNPSGTHDVSCNLQG